MLKQTRLLGLATIGIAVIAWSAGAEESSEKLVVKVLSAEFKESKVETQPVVSRILIVQSDGKRRDAGTTGPDGLFERSYKCELGDKVRAEPNESGLFFSREDTCKQKLDLIVVRRPTPTSVAAIGKAETFTKIIDGQPRTVTLVKYGYVTSQTMQTSNAGPFASPTGNCRLVIDKELQTEAFFVGDDGKWNGLPSIKKKIEPTTYTWAGSCEAKADFLESKKVQELNKLKGYFDLPTKF